MGTFKVMLKNGWTTVAGFLAGFIYYVAQSGLTIPSTKQEAWNLAIGLALGYLGLTAKSATTGSKPT